MDVRVVDENDSGRLHQQLVSGRSLWVSIVATTFLLLRSL